jgi:hypothetical protein
MYVPTAVPENVRGRIVEQAVEEYGGCTVTDGDGHWQGDRKLYDEPVKIISISAQNPDKNLDEFAEFLLNTSKKILMNMRSCLR